jgi:hypothetical protein
MHQKLVISLLALFVNICNIYSQNSIYQSSPIIKERIQGLSNIREKPNGKILFTLYDSTLITCTIAENSWYNIGLEFGITKEENNSGVLRQGRKIIIGQKIVGIIVTDIKFEPYSYGEDWVQLSGYTYKSNIYEWSIIERNLEQLLKNISLNRNKIEFLNFISNFQLEKDTTAKPYISYHNYENWIDDPSPQYRIVLVFHDNQLIGIAHTRKLQIHNTTDYKAERKFNLLFFNNTSVTLKKRYLQIFNRNIWNWD